MIVVKSTANSIRQGMSMTFVASGGVGPYVYSVQSGGAGGTINSSTGVYQAPSVPGVDTIIATDSLLATGSRQIFIRHPIQLFCDVVQQYMSLASDQIYIYNQKFKIPNDSKLYIAVGVLFNKSFGTSKNYNASSGFQEELSINTNCQLKLDLLSRSTDALFRQEEIVMALNSDYSKRQQALNGFFIANQPMQFTDLSTEEGSAMLYRYNTTINMQYSVLSKKNSEYYNEFPDIEIITEG